VRGHGAAELTLLILVTSVAMSGCDRQPRPVGRGASAASDSSFAAVTYRTDVPPLELAAAHGRSLYARYCAICHGDEGGGDGFNAYNIEAAYGLAPTAFADSAAFASLDSDTALAVIRNGGSRFGKSAAMPPWGHTLTAGEVVDVWLFVASLHRATETAEQTRDTP
jgi:mono/diheme cytochrome c family protein